MTSIRQAAEGFLTTLGLSFSSPLVLGVWYFALILVLIGVVLISTAYLTYFERKVLGKMQYRVSINVTGFFGLLQPLADGLKLLLKEMIIPQKSKKLVFLAAPFLTFVCALTAWGIIPFGEGVVLADINIGLLLILAISSINVLSLMMAGWSSNSRYAYLGAIRSGVQMISYELALTTAVSGVVMLSGSLNLSEIVMAQKNTTWFLFPLFPLAVIFFICMLAETGRTPFDLPEGESEIVAGYFVEYTGFGFALFYLSEYANMILLSVLMVLLFLGGWLPPYSYLELGFFEGFFWLVFKTLCVLFLFLWVRASVPGYRPNQLIKIGWKILLPFSMFFVVLEAIFLYTHHILTS